jgi:hypothetical protein
MTCISEVLSSNLGRDTNYPNEVICGFLQYFHANASAVPRSSHDRFFPIHPTILRTALSTSWRCGQLHASAALHPGKEPLYRLNRRLGDPRAGLDDVENWKFLILLGIELRPLGRPARSQSLYLMRYPGSCKNLEPNKNISVQEYCLMECDISMLKWYPCMQPARIKRQAYLV